MMRARPANLPARPVQPRVIVGFDSEWVVDGPRNRMLSYQLVVLNAAAGKRCNTAARAASSLSMSCGSPRGLPCSYQRK